MPIQIFERDIAIDMGTSSTLLFEQGKGIVAREPTVVAVDKFSGKIMKVGQDAQHALSILTHQHRGNPAHQRRRDFRL